MARVIRPALVIALIGAIVWLCGGTLFPQGRGGGTARIVVYGFSILAEPLREDIFPLFREEWRAKTGEDVEFLDSFGGSGTIANQIINGTPADVAIFAHPGDADRLVKAGRALADWRAGEYGGIVNRTAMVIAVRSGNPKHFQDFADLGRAGIEIVHPDPLTSGGAQWAILAEYAEPLIRARANGRPPSPEVAYAQLAAIWRNVVAQAPSARAARTQFDQGFGDALITYEVELLLDRRHGKTAEMVVPASTILTEHPVVLVDRNVSPAKRPVVEAFVKFLTSDKAQRAFVRHGYRSVKPELDAENPALSRLANPFTVAELGGWDAAQREIIEVAWKAHALAEARK